MKNVIISIGLVLITIITTLILLTVYGQNTRQNELDDALSSSVEQSLDNLKISKTYTINDTDEFIADFMQNLVVQIESDSELEVNVLSVDTEKGLLDVEVVETFRQPNGTKGTVSCRKTVILEEYRQKEPVYYFVKFKTIDFKEDGGSVKFVKNDDGEFAFNDYKTFSICEGSQVIFPETPPVMKGYTFKGWSLTAPTDDNDFSPEIVDLTTEEGTMTVTNELVFYAVFKEAAN